MIPHAPLLSVILPIISGVILYAFGKRVEKYVGWVATIEALLSVLMILSMVTDLIERDPIHDEYVWIHTLSIHVTLGFVVNVISLPIGLIVAVVRFFSCFYSIKYMEDERGQVPYYANICVHVPINMFSVVFLRVATADSAAR